MLLGVALLALGASACGSSTPTPQKPVAVTATTVVTETTTVTALPPSIPTSSATAAAQSETGKASDKPAAELVVPDGVGLNYQQAQDLWRGAGLVVTPAHDATGANRLPVIDRNWVVLSQDPKPGTRVPADSMITATVKKFTDD